MVEELGLDMDFAGTCFIVRQGSRPRIALNGNEDFEALGLCMRAETE